MKLLQLLHDRIVVSTFTAVIMILIIVMVLYKHMK